MSNSTCPLIAANSDVAGIGVRAALYIQAFCLLIVSVTVTTQLVQAFNEFMHEDRKSLEMAFKAHCAKQQELRVALEKTAFSMLFYGCALVISGIVQAVYFGLTPYHGYIVVISTMITAFCAFPAQLCLGLENGWEDITFETVFLFAAHSIHLSLTGCFSVWFFRSIPSAGSGSDAACETLVDILGYHISLANPTLHRFGIGVSYLMAIPAVNVILVGLVCDLGYIFNKPFWELAWYILGRSKLSAKTKAICSALMPVSLPFVFVVIMTHSLEATIVTNHVQPGEEQWTLGQTLSLSMTIIPVMEVVESVRELWKARITSIESYMPMAIQPIWWLAKAQYRKAKSSLRIARELVPPPNNPTAGVYVVLILASSVTSGAEVMTTTSPSEDGKAYSSERDEDLFRGRIPPTSARDVVVLAGYDEHAIVDRSACAFETGNERRLQLWIKSSPGSDGDATTIAAAVVRRMKALKFHADAGDEVTGFGDVVLLPLPWYTKYVHTSKVFDDLEAP